MLTMAESSRNRPMGVISAVCAAFGVILSEAKTEIKIEIMSLRAKGVPEKRVRIPRGERPPQCRPAHRGRPTHTQRTVQLPEVHPRTVPPTERYPRAQNPDAKSRGTRLRHVEPARVPLRHAAPRPPQVLDSLHRLAKEQSRRPPDFLPGHAHQDGMGSSTTVTVGCFKYHYCTGGRLPVLCRSSTHHLLILIAAILQ